MGKRVVTVGDLVLDIIMPVELPVRPWRHQTASRRNVQPGGMANFVLTAVNFGLDVSVAGAVGTDAFAPLILEPMRERGVDLTNVVAIPNGGTTLVIVLTDKDEDKHVFVGQHGEGPEAPYPEKLDETIKAADALFLEGYSLVEKSGVSMASRALDRAYEVGTPIYLDAGPFLKYADPEQVRRVLERTHLLFLADDEAPYAAEGEVGPNAFARLLTMGPKFVIAKRAAKGSMVVTPDWWLDIPPYPVERIVDSVGAGDTFDAVFMAALFQGLPLQDCAKLANAAGSLIVQRVGGGVTAPTCEETLALLRAAGDEVNFSCSK